MNEVALSELISLYQSGRLDDAERGCLDVLSRVPDQLEATYLLGRIRLDRSDTASAILMLRRAVQIAPDWPEAHADLGAALFLRNRLDEAAHHIRQAAALDPNDAEAQNNLGVALQAGGRAKEAEAAFLRALELRPQYPEALHNLGSILFAFGRYSEAVERFQQALLLDSDNAELFLGLGDACVALGDLAAAEFEFRRVLARHPGLQRAIDGLEAVREAQSRAGSVLDCVRAGAENLDRGETDAAEAAFRQALALSPEDDRALRGLAALMVATRRFDEAQPLIEDLLRRQPHHAELRNNYGVALAGLGKVREAAEQYRKVLEIDPSHRSALGNLVHALSDLGDAEEAMATCRRALQMWPDSADLHDALGAVLAERGDIPEAAAAFQEAIRLNPRMATAWMNLGAMRIREGDDLKAIRHLRRAIDLDPNEARALDELGLIYLSRGRLEAGEEMLRRAIAISPHSPRMHIHLGSCLLARERYEEGWAEMERRLELPSCREPLLSAPKWGGESNPSGTLLVYSEQVFGDNIQHVRYLDTVKSRWQGRVVYFAYPELAALFKASGLPAEIVPLPRSGPVPQETAYPQEGYDAYISLMSLPWLFGTVTETIPANVPYLRAPEDRAQAWRERIETGPELKVGIQWAGRRSTRVESRRACDLPQLAPLAGIPGVRFYSLQTGADAMRLEEAPDGLRLVNLGKDIVDFADTAAILQHMDLFISIDSAPAHLAGALGRPAWTLVPALPDSRWLLHREDSPWYPTLRLFRQSRPHVWAPLWDQVAQELRSLVESGRSPGG